MAFRPLVPFGWGTPARRGEDPFTSLRRDIDRLFEDFFRGPSLAPREDAGTAAVLTPRIDVSETDQAIQINAELPGVDEKNIDVQLSGDMLTIRGEKRVEREEKHKDKNYHLIERAYGAFARTIRLPFDADPDKVEASFDKGVLTVTVPKPEEAQQKTKRIEVKKGAA